MKKLQKTDGWCAVVALAAVTGLAEDLVVSVCEFHGFHPHDGMEDSEIMAAAKELGLKLKPMRITPQRLRQFMRRHKTGVFLACSQDHILVVRDGKMFDPVWGSLDIIIKWGWRVV